MPCLNTFWLLICVAVYANNVAFESVAAESHRVLPAGQLPQDSRLGPLKNLNGYFPFAPPASREAWEQRASGVRRQVLIAAGLWPMPEKSPLNAVIHGRVDRNDYTVEKVYFESIPDFYVTGNLYRPKNFTGKRPAVLCPHGHWPNGRFYDAGPKEIRKQIVEGAERFELGGRYPVQARCVQLARMGCIVFQYDMVGYADSKQLVHRDGDRPELNSPKSWTFFGPQAEARLQSVFGLQTYDSIRALDFVCQLPDVDPARIGVTGCSGGATQTMILCAIDPRPAAAFPAVMVSTAMQGGCPCENADYLRIDSGNIELAALFAPKPLGMTAADDWTKEIAAKGLPELKRLYRLYGAEDMVMAKPLLQFPHNYNYVSRAVMYAWFNKYLKLGFEEPIVEQDFRPLSTSEMTVWDAEHHAPPSGPDFERSLLKKMAACSRRQLENLAPKDEKSLVEYRRTVGGAVETLIGRGLPKSSDLATANSTSQNFGEWKMTKFLLRYAPNGEELPTIRLDPKNWNRRAVIWVEQTGKQAIFTAAGEPKPIVKTLLEKGFSVVSADLFGQGEFAADGVPLTKTRLNESKRYETNDRWIRYAGFTFGYNPPVFSQRVRDILSLVAFARSEKYAAELVDVIGLDGAGHWVAAARAIAGDKIDCAAIDTSGFRFANLVAIDDPDFLPGGAKYGDLPGMIALSAPYPLWLTGENDAAGSPISAAYRAASRANDLTVCDKSVADVNGALVEWLLMKD